MLIKCLSAPRPETRRSRRRGLGGLGWGESRAKVDGRETGVEVEEQEVRYRLEVFALSADPGTYLRNVDGLQNKAVNGLLAQVFGNFRPGVVRAEGFLVDVLFKDIPEHVRVDFVVGFTGQVV